MPEIPALQTNNLDFSNALQNMAVMKRQREQDAALAETRGLQNEVIRGQIANQPAQNELAKMQTQREILAARKEFNELAPSDTNAIINTKDPILKRQHIDSYYKLGSSVGMRLPVPESYDIKDPTTGAVIGFNQEAADTDLKLIAIGSAKTNKVLANGTPSYTIFKDPKDNLYKRQDFTWQDGKTVPNGEPYPVENKAVTQELDVKKTNADIKKGEETTAQGWENVKTNQRNAQTNAERADIYRIKTLKPANPKAANTAPYYNMITGETAYYNKSDKMPAQFVSPALAKQYIADGQTTPIWNTKTKKMEFKKPQEAIGGEITVDGKTTTLPGLIGNGTYVNVVQGEPGDTPWGTRTVGSTNKPTPKAARTMKPQSTAKNKTLVKQQRNTATGQIRNVYSDGTVEIVN
ncbi:hypothetical protein M0R04_09535 [Candidatus Dojkabacteria bacterium]|nr:hypothetical protein [Candidatus Dojkabacteria bacterium]